MRFLADENFPGSAVAALSHAGHELDWIRTSSPGLSDREVLTRTVREKRILLTYDKDFGELARNAKLPTSCGVILFRIPVSRGYEFDAQVAAIKAGRADWAGHI